MKLEDIAIPAHHLIVHVGQRQWDQITVVTGDTGAEANHIVMYPDFYRVVPVAVVDELIAMRERHEKENADLTARIKAMPQIRVSVTAE